MEGLSAKSTAYVNLITQLQAQNVPIHGVGLQAHLIVGNVPTTIQQNMEQFAALGLEIAITELDIAGASASDYSNVVKTCLAQAKCIGITVWGVSDKDSWRSSSTPLLYDSNYQPKAAYNSVLSALS